MCTELPTGPALCLDSTEVRWNVGCVWEISPVAPVNVSGFRE